MLSDLFIVFDWKFTDIQFELSFPSEKNKKFTTGVLLSSLCHMYHT